MKKWHEIKVGDLVKCAVMPNLGMGVVVKIKRFEAGQANAMCYWATLGAKRTYFLDQLVYAGDSDV